MNELREIENFVTHEMEIVVSGSANFEDLKAILAEKFSELINTDFDHLIQLLYRIDINEMKLKEILKKNQNDDAGKLLAELTIERQLQKIRSKKLNTKRDKNISDDEKW